MLDADLALIYGVPTKRLNEQVKRNSKRFPGDFVFQVTAAEKSELVENCDHLARLKFSPVLPLAFTEKGAVMASDRLVTRTLRSANWRVLRLWEHKLARKREARRLRRIRRALA